MLDELPEKRKAFHQADMLMEGLAQRVSPHVGLEKPFGFDCRKRQTKSNASFFSSMPTTIKASPGWLTLTDQRSLSVSGKANALCAVSGGKL